MKKTLIFFLLIFLPCASFAKTAEVKLFLTEIECLKPSEKKGDEIYLSISEKIEGIDEEFDRVEHQIPFYPGFWLSDNLSKIKNVVLWKGKVSNHERALGIALMERDLGPNDLIGNLGVKLVFKNNKLIVKWTEGNQKNLPITQNGYMTKKITFSRNNSLYKVRFKIKYKFSD